MLGRDVTIPGPTGDRPGYAALPAGARRGVVVLHEIFGRQPEIDRVVEKLAALGYAAVAPDLFGGRWKLACIRRIMQAIQTGDGPMVDEVHAARAWLCGETGLPAAHVGLIGFCLGGGFALACGPDWAAVSTNYGVIPAEEVLRGLPPVIGCYGGRDRTMARSPGQLEERLTRLGVPHEIHVFPEAGHTFLTDGHHPVAAFLSRPMMHVEWNPEVAARGWEKILQFFDRHVAPVPDRV